jgi:DNA repair protein RadA/Sms
MATKQAAYACSSCKQEYLKWQGVCYGCDKYNTIALATKKTSTKTTKKEYRIKKIADVVSGLEDTRLATGITELDRVLGGGFIASSVFLLCGEPGVGKSTFLLTVISSLCERVKVVYISTEENDIQVKNRLCRIKNKKEDWLFVKENSFEEIQSIIEETKPELLIIDSLQNITFDSQEELSSSIARLRYYMHTLVETAKKNNCILIITGHITKEGTLAGPKVLEHLVDTVLYLEKQESSAIRLLRATKNRFGSTDETGFFVMKAEGIISYENPQDLFLENLTPAVGSTISWVMTGSRPFLIEIQTLLNRTKSQTPQRVIYGIESKQFLLLCAVIEKYLHLPLYQFDIFCKVATSYKGNMTHLDLALVGGILSSYYKKAPQEKMLFHGEVSLSGRVITKYAPPASLLLHKYGITKVVSPYENKKETKKTIKITTIEELTQLFN